MFSENFYLGWKYFISRGHLTSDNTFASACYIWKINYYVFRCKIIPNGVELPCPVGCHLYWTTGNKTKLPVAICQFHFISDFICDGWKTRWGNGCSKYIFLQSVARDLGFVSFLRANKHVLYFVFYCGYAVWFVFPTMKLLRFIFVPK